MAFGIGKTFKKAWKGTVGKLEDAVDPVKNTIVNAGIGFVASGFNPIGAVIGATTGYMQDRNEQQQEKAVKAQIASAEKIAAMQNNTVVSAAPIPTQTVQQAALREQNDATRKARAFRLANSVRSGTLGGGGSNSGKKKVLG